MSRACGLLLLTAVVVGVGSAPPAEAQAKRPTIKLGLLQGMFKDVPPAVLQHVSKPFAELFTRQTGLNGDTELVADCDALATRMSDKQIHVGVFHGFEYAWVKDRHPHIKALATTIPPGRKVQACLVVNVGEKAAVPTELKGETVIVPTYTKAHCHLYLERLRADLPANCCVPVKGNPVTPDEALDAIAGGQKTAVLVDISSLNSYELNKPGGFSQLKVLARSEVFPPAVIAYRDGVLSPITIAQIRNGLVKANQTAQGRAFMMLWKLKGFEDVPAGFDAELDRIGKAYPPPTPAAAARPR